MRGPGRAGRRLLAACTPRWSAVAVRACTRKTASSHSPMNVDADEAPTASASSAWSPRAIARSGHPEACGVRELDLPETSATNKRPLAGRQPEQERTMSDLSKQNHGDVGCEGGVATESPWPSPRLRKRLAVAVSCAEGGSPERSAARPSRWRSPTPAIAAERPGSSNAISRRSWFSWWASARTCAHCRSDTGRPLILLNWRPTTGIGPTGREALLGAPGGRAIVFSTGCANGSLRRSRRRLRRAAAT